MLRLVLEDLSSAWPFKWVFIVAPNDILRFLQRKESFDIASSSRYIVLIVSSASRPAFRSAFVTTTLTVSDMRLTIVYTYINFTSTYSLLSYPRASFGRPVIYRWVV